VLLALTKIGTASLIYLILIFFYNWCRFTHLPIGAQLIACFSKLSSTTSAYLRSACAFLIIGSSGFLMDRPKEFSISDSLYTTHRLRYLKASWSQILCIFYDDVMQELSI